MPIGKVIGKIEVEKAVPKVANFHEEKFQNVNAPKSIRFEEVEKSQPDTRAEVESSDLMKREFWQPKVW